MSAIGSLIPTPRLHEIDRQEVAAAREQVWRRIRHGDLAQSPLIRALFAVRTLPERLSGRAKGAPGSIRIDDLVSTPERPGFHLFVDHPPYEFAVGAIGRVWQLEIPFLHVADAEEFAHLATPGYVKVAWSIHLYAVSEQVTQVELELRVDATDADSWEKFKRYFLLIGPASRLIRRRLLVELARELGDSERSRSEFRDVLEGVGGIGVMIGALLTPFLRGFRDHWGLDAREAARRYPGDEWVPKPEWGYTHAVTVDAPPERVWPWLAQIGADRGGFYSYQWLENLAGCGVSNAETVHPNWEVQLGEAVLLHPDMPAPRVVDLSRGRYFVLHAAADAEARERGKPWTTMSWTFLVEPWGNGKSRVTSRYRAAASSDLGTRLAFGPTLIEPVGFAMDRRMLLGIKARAESARRAA